MVRQFLVKFHLTQLHEASFSGSNIVTRHRMISIPSEISTVVVVHKFNSHSYYSVQWQEFTVNFITMTRL